MATKLTIITKRKRDHLAIALSDDAQVGDSGFDLYRFEHNALPEIDFDKIDTTTSFLGKQVNQPFFISCMTGGAEKAGMLNRNLAKAAQKKGIAMGVGSQRAAIEHKELRGSFAVRRYAPDIPIMANVGLVQLNYGFGLKELRECVQMVDADALVFHINPIQEIIQPEGDRNFSSLLPKLAKVIDKVGVPVIVKEVGFGLSYNVVKRFYDIGVSIFDTAGWGGTNWALVEGMRGKADRQLGELFSNWGIPTTESIKQLVEFKSKIKRKSKKTYSTATGYKPPYTILGSGGVRNGIDIAKCLALGADLAGVAAPFAQAALVSARAVEELIDRYAYELRVAMFGVGAISVKALQSSKLHNSGAI